MSPCSTNRTQPEESLVVHFVDPLYEFKSLNQITPESHFTCLKRLNILSLSP
uniref:Uncharacterized protein n=1 Tax=Anguilla anguilla TaxID=7936 RepID=A0A0E9XRK9_ANGAN